LIAPYANPDQFIEHETPQENLLTEVLAFQKASLAGEYYEETPITARSREEISRRTLCWIADVRRLLGRCAAESSSASAADACRAFEILFGLLDSLDDGTGEGIIFAEENGSWMVGVDWKRVLPEWFRVLAVTAAPDEFSRRVEAMISHHCYGEQAEMLVLARSVEMSVRQKIKRNKRTR